MSEIDIANNKFSIAHNIARGLTIIDIARRKNGIDDIFHVEARQNEILAGNLEWEMPAEKRQELIQRGWVEDIDSKCWSITI